MGMEYHLTIKDIPAENRPRERLVQLGPGALATSELVAILLGTGSQTESALELAQRLVAGNCPQWQGSGIRALQDASIEEMAKVKGVGLAKAARVKAALELGRRLQVENPGQRPVIKSPRDAAALLLEEMRYLDREQFRLVLLSTKNHVIAVETGFIGSLDSSLVHPRELFRTCIRRSARAVILVHNHPSGDPTPSPEDIQMTHRLLEGAAILGIDILDHIIIGDGSFLSMKEKGII